MSTETLQMVLEAVQQLSTLIVFLLIFALVAKFILAMTFSMDLLLLIATFFAIRVLSRQQTVRRMGRSAGMHPLYTKRQCDEIFRIFLAGYHTEQAAGAPHPS